MQQISLIIPAGGASSRFFKSYKSGTGSKKRAPASKLLFPLDGVPLLAHSLRTFCEVPEIKEIILAVPPSIKKEVKELTTSFNKKRWIVTNGGKTRAESVRNGLRKSNPKFSWVMVHDGARPFIEKKGIKKLIASAKKYDGSIIAKKVVPTIKEVKRGRQVTQTVDREFLYEAETPQLVKRSLLKKAYQKKEVALKATDEASLIEMIGGRVCVMPHAGWNPKITTAQDYELAEAYIQRTTKSAGQSVLGLGKDTHRLVEGRKLYLGGVHVPSSRGALGHSDGDVILHAIIDGILGALGLGDIGDWFSDRDPKFKGIRSEKMLREVMKALDKHKASIVHIDTVVTLEKPKLGAYKQKIRKNIARILKEPESKISIKAKTAEGLGAEGSGAALSCEAIVTLHRSCHPRML